MTAALTPGKGVELDFIRRQSGFVGFPCPFNGRGPRRGEGPSIRADLCWGVAACRW